MNPALVAGASQLLGGLLGGGRRDKRAMRQLRELQDAADFVFDRAVEDQDRARAYRDEDEASLREATGYDFKKLRDDARAAGFNPLTALMATGGAGYDGRGAVIQSPFVSFADAARTRVDARIGGSHLAVDNAGYVGDAIAGAGSAFVSTALTQAQMLAEAEVNKALAGVAAGATAPVRGAMRASVQSPFDVSALPVAKTTGYGDMIETAAAGSVLTFGDHLLPGGGAKGSPFAGRVEQTEPFLNAPMTKRVEDWFGNTYQVWNDEAMESEVAAAMSLIVQAPAFAYNLGNAFAKRVANPYIQRVAPVIKDWRIRGDEPFQGRIPWDKGPMNFRLN